MPIIIGAAAIAAIIFIWRGIHTGAVIVRNSYQAKHPTQEYLDAVAQDEIMERFWVGIEPRNADERRLYHQWALEDLNSVDGNYEALDDQQYSETFLRRWVAYKPPTA